MGRPSTAFPEPYLILPGCCDDCLVSWLVWLANAFVILKVSALGGGIWTRTDPLLGVGVCVPFLLVWGFGRHGDFVLLRLVHMSGGHVCRPRHGAQAGGRRSEKGRRSCWVCSSSFLPALAFLGSVCFVDSLLSECRGCKEQTVFLTYHGLRRCPEVGAEVRKSRNKCQVVTPISGPCFGT